MGVGMDQTLTPWVLRISGCYWTFISSQGREIIVGWTKALRRYVSPMIRAWDLRFKPSIRDPYDGI